LITDVRTLQLELFQLYSLNLQSNPKAFTYYMIPCNMGTQEPLIRKTEEGPFAMMVYPYTQLGPLRSHIHPHFVIFNAALKLANNGHQFYENILKNLQPHYPEKMTSIDKAMVLCLHIRNIYDRWMLNRVEPGGYRPPKSCRREDSGGDGRCRDVSARSQGKLPNYDDPSPPTSKRFGGNAAQGGSGGKKDDPRNPRLIMDNGFESPNDAVSWMDRYSTMSSGYLVERIYDENKQSDAIVDELANQIDNALSDVVGNQELHLLSDEESDRINRWRIEVANTAQEDLRVSSFWCSSWSSCLIHT
jgi:hypothetical protein